MADDKIIIGSDAELIEQVMQDCTELFKRYVYRYHPRVDPLDFVISVRPYLDSAECYVKNMPVMLSTFYGEPLYMATPDPERFHAVPYTNTVDQDTTESEVPEPKTTEDADYVEDLFE